MSKLVPGTADQQHPKFLRAATPVLRDASGKIAYYLKFTERDETSVTVKLFHCDGFYEPPHHDEPPNTNDEIGILFLKWDGCAHLGLQDPELGPWTHVCGHRHFRETLQALEWMWRVAQDSIPKFDPNERLQENP